MWQAEKATAIKEDAEKDLNEALPALNVAEKALKALKLSSLQDPKHFVTSCMNDMMLYDMTSFYRRWMRSYF